MMSQSILKEIESTLNVYMASVYCNIQASIKRDYDIDIPTEQLQKYTTQKYVSFEEVKEKSTVVEVPTTTTTTPKKPTPKKPTTKKQTAAAQQLVFCSQVKKKGGETCKRKAAVGSSLCTFHGKIEEERKEVVVEVMPEVKPESKEKKWLSVSTEESSSSSSAE